MYRNLHAGPRIYRYNAGYITCSFVYGPKNWAGKSAVEVNCYLGAALFVWKDGWSTRGRMSCLPSEHEVANWDPITALLGCRSAADRLIFLFVRAAQNLQRMENKLMRREMIVKVIGKSRHR